MGSQVGRHLIDDHRRNQRLVTLDVDHDGIGSQAQLGSHFGQAVGTGVMVFAGHQHFGAEGLADLEDARVIGGNYHAAGTASARLFPDVLDHRLAGDRQQWLARQARGAQPRRNHNGKGQAHLSRRSSSVRVRASLSSITGMPSRIG
ncbi:hypothetical protein D3C81_625730 [compost metagenome]